MERDNESRSWKARTFVICAAAGVLTVASIGVVFRQDLETRYHLYRIRIDIRHALTLVAQPEGTPERRAIRRYIESLEFHGELPKASPSQSAPGGAIVAGSFPPAEPIDVSAGDIPVEECCRFLSDWTGLAAIMDSDLWDAGFTVPESIQAVDGELMGLLLAAHDYSLTVKTLPNQRQVLRLRMATGSREPSSDAGRLEGLSLPRADIAQGMILMNDLATWVDARSDASISVSPGVQNKQIRLAAPIQGADIYVVQELVSASGCVIERRDEDSYRIRAAETAVKN